MSRGLNSICNSPATVRIRQVLTLVGKTCQFGQARFLSTPSRHFSSRQITAIWPQLLGNPLPTTTNAGELQCLPFIGVSLVVGLRGLSYWLCKVRRAHWFGKVQQVQKPAAILTYGCSQWHCLAPALSFGFLPLVVKHCLQGGALDHLVNLYQGRGCAQFGRWEGTVTNWHFSRSFHFYFKALTLVVTVQSLAQTQTYTP